MKKIAFITSNRCVYCKKAKNLLNRIKILYPQYCLEHVEVMDIFDAKKKKLVYKKLPCFYVGDERVHEGYITIDRLVEILEAAQNDKPINFIYEE